jgi:hypothetical protein
VHAGVLRDLDKDPQWDGSSSKFRTLQRTNTSTLPANQASKRTAAGLTAATAVRRSMGRSSAKQQRQCSNSRCAACLTDRRTAPTGSNPRLCGHCAAAEQDYPWQWRVGSRWLWPVQVRRQASNCNLRSVAAQLGWLAGITFSAVTQLSHSLLLTFQWLVVILTLCTLHHQGHPCIMHTLYDARRLR